MNKAEGEDGWSRGASPPSSLVSFGAGQEPSGALIRLTRAHLSAALTQ